MKVIVFGANGRVGSLVVKELLARGHEVTAFVHGNNSFASHPLLHVVSGDVQDPQDVVGALKNVQVVISTLGSWGTPTKDILSKGMQAIVPAMQAQGLTRIVSLTGSAACKPGDNWGFFAKLARQGLKLIAPEILKDGEQHIQTLIDSGLQWTVVRSPVMKDGDSTSYTLNDKVPGALERVNRQAVAKALVDRLSNETFVQQAPHIHQA